MLRMKQSNCANLWVERCFIQWNKQSYNIRWFKKDAHLAELRMSGSASKRKLNRVNRTFLRRESGMRDQGQHNKILRHMALDFKS